MNRNDRKLIRKAKKVKYWNYHKAYIYVRLAESKEAKQELRNIASFLYDWYHHEL